MFGKVHHSKDELFQQSLKSWGDDDNRPFIRINVDEDRDQFEYERKWRKIREEQKRISKITGDPIENINLIDAWGHEYSIGGNISDFENL